MYNFILFKSSFTQHLQYLGWTFAEKSTSASRVGDSPTLPLYCQLKLTVCRIKQQPEILCREQGFKNTGLLNFAFCFPYFNLCDRPTTLFKNTSAPQDLLICSFPRFPKTHQKTGTLRCHCLINLPSLLCQCTYINFHSNTKSLN